MILAPSREVWDATLKANWRQRTITPLSIASAIAERIAGREVSGMTSMILRDLCLVGKNDRPNKKGRNALATYLRHCQHKDCAPLEIAVPPLPYIKPLTGQQID